MAQKTQFKGNIPDLGHLPISGGDQQGTRWLIGAVLAAGKDGCSCVSCKLLQKFGAAMSEAVLQEEETSGDQDS